MNPGRMNRRLSLFTLTRSKDSVGGNVETWSSAGSIWAEEIQNRQSEQIVSDSDRNTETRTFRIRWKSGLNSTDYRITYQGKNYDIKSVTEIGVKDRMMITVESTSNLELG